MGLAGTEGMHLLSKSKGAITVTGITWGRSYSCQSVGYCWAEGTVWGRMQKQKMALTHCDITSRIR